MIRSQSFIRNRSIVEPLNPSLSQSFGLRCTLLRTTHALRLPGYTPRDLPSDLNSRAVFLVISTGAEAADTGETAQQVGAHRLDSSRGCTASQHRELPCIR